MQVTMVIQMGIGGLYRYHESVSIYVGATWASRSRSAQNYLGISDTTYIKLPQIAGESHEKMVTVPCYPRMSGEDGILAAIRRNEAFICKCISI